MFTNSLVVRWSTAWRRVMSSCISSYTALFELVLTSPDMVLSHKLDFICLSMFLTNLLTC